MVRYVFGGAALGGLLVILGGLFLGPSVHVTSSVNDERHGSGKYVVHIDETDEGTTFTVVDTETGEARMFDDTGATVTLPRPSPE